MKAYVVRSSGSPDVLEYTDLPDPIVKSGWVNIKVEAFGLNRSEMFTRQGHSPAVKFPRLFTHDLAVDRLFGRDCPLKTAGFSILLTLRSQR